MSQASDLGAVANQLAALYRARVNANIQAVVTQHSGASEPAVMYANMVWFDSGTGTVKLRDATNTSWATIGSIGPPFKWTAFDAPDTAFTTGDVKMTLKAAADSGWLMMNDGSIGSASSGATSRANPDAQALFTLLWTNISDTCCTLYAANTSTPTGRGASAAADWAAHRHLLLPKVLGRALAAAGWGAGLTSRALGSSLGAESVALLLGNLPAHTHSLPTHSHDPGTLAATNAGAHTHSAGNGLQLTGHTSSGFSPDGGPYTLGGATTGSAGAHTHTLTGTSAAGGGGASGSAGSGTAHDNMQPTSFLNVMIKL